MTDKVNKIKWSQDVSKNSNALDLEQGVFILKLESILCI